MAFSSAVRLSSSSPKRLSTNALALRSCRYSTNKVFLRCNYDTELHIGHCNRHAVLLTDFVFCQGCSLIVRKEVQSESSTGMSKALLSTKTLCKLDSCNCMYHLVNCVVYRLTMFALAFCFLAQDVKLLAVIQPLEQVWLAFLSCTLPIGALSGTFCFRFLLRHRAYSKR